MSLRAIIRTPLIWSVGDKSEIEMKPVPRRAGFVVCGLCPLPQSARLGVSGSGNGRRFHSGEDRVDRLFFEPLHELELLPFISGDMRLDGVFHSAA